MRRVFALFLVVVTASCSLSDEDTNFEFVRLSVESAEAPESVFINVPFEIQVNYLRPTDCHFVEGFELLSVDESINTFTYALIGSFIDQNACQVPESNELQIGLDFVISIPGSYIFRFWQGTDDEGQDQFLTLQIPVGLE